ncbi:MAG: ATP-binding protein [Lyngbya sp.]|nr:ATP-binding protein [Lyngbya sp.]
MLKTLKIENFRGFQSFELQPLGRVNLLVGENNSGKTSILEAIQLLRSVSNIEKITEIMNCRGEYFWSENDRRERIEFEICHLFNSHDIKLGRRFLISGMNKNSEDKLVASIELRGGQLYLFKEFEELELAIKWTRKGNTEDLNLPLSPNGSLSLVSSREGFKATARIFNKTPIRTQLITSSSLSAETMIELFDEVVLRSEEKLIYEALKTVEPKIERIASVSSNKYRSSSSRGGFVVLLSDRQQRIPIGSLGDGIWRMLGLSLALASVKGGVLLVDEIDTGLHYSTMSDLWKLIWEAAKKLDVQVFATTHNSDCWTSLASIASREDATEDGITIHRIERGKEKSVVFTEKEIVMAAEREIEVR